MAKWIAAVVLAFVVGAAAAYAWFAFAPGAAAIVARGDANTARQPVSDSQAAKAEQSREYTTLAEITALASDFEQTAALYALLRTADEATLERLLEDAEGLRPRRERLAAKSIIYARYAELDPLAAVERVLAQERDKHEMLDRVFMAWGKHDLEAALAHAQTIQGPLRQPAASAALAVSEHLDPARREALAAAFSLQDTLPLMEDFEGDPVVAWRDALAIESAQARAQRLLQIGDAWVQQDPAAALAAALELPSSGMFGGVVPYLIERWAEQDADDALAWVLAQPESRARAEMLGALAGGIAQRSPQEALALAETLDGAARRQVAQAALQAWAQTDAPAAMSALEELDDIGLSNDARFSILAQWSTSDPRAAFAWALTQRSSMDNMHLAVLPLQRIAMDDPAEALRLAEELDGMRKQAALGSIVSTWADNDPEAAAAWLESADGDMPQALSAVAFAFAQRSPREAFEWVSTLPKKSQQVALHSLVSATASHSPEQAVSLIATIRDAELRTEATTTLVMGWAQNAPQDAAAWVGRNADAEQRPTLYHQVFHAWGFHDRDAAAAELRQLRRQEDRDWAALGLVSSAAFDNAEFAERVYDRMRGEEQKREAARMLYHGLLQVDRDRAERFRKRAGIEDQEQLGLGGSPGAPVFFAPAVIRD